TSFSRDWSSDVCSSDLITPTPILVELVLKVHGLIPSLVQAFSTRQPDPWDVEPLKQAAFTLAEGGSIDVVPEVSAAGAEVAAPATGRASGREGGGCGGR